jgi:lipopolysaccharide export system protein LptA
MRTPFWFSCCFFLATAAYGAPDSSRLPARNDNPIYVKDSSRLPARNDNPIYVKDSSRLPARNDNPIYVKDSSRLPTRNDNPIHIKADQLLTDTKNSTATFTGKVTARQGELALYAERIVVHYAPKGGNVELVECSGTVRIVQKNRTGTAGNAVYDNKQGKIVLTVNPKVYQGEDMISGSEITYDIAEQNSIVTGSSTVRVEAVLHPKGKRDGNTGN